MKRALCALAILISIVGNTTGQTLLERSRKDEIKRVPREDAAMAKAFRKAKDTLDDFLVIATNPPPGAGGFAVKVPVAAGGDSEYFWITPFSWQGNAFQGLINNTPRMAKHVRLGQQIKFDRSEIVDWMYTDRARNRMYGNFTACAMLTRESLADAEKFRKHFGLECDL